MEVLETRMERGYKYRLYPTEDQEKRIKQNIGTCRYVYNKALAWRVEAYKADRSRVSYEDTCNALVAAKKYFPWIEEADGVSLQQKLRDLDRAFQNFFIGRAGFPEYKSKRKHRLSYRTMNNGNIKVVDGGIQLPKLGVVRAVITRSAPKDWKLKSATVSQEKDGTFYASLLYSNKAVSDPDPLVSIDEEKAIGLDYRSDGLYVDDRGRNFHMDKHFRKSERRLRKAQKKMSHMIESHITGYKEKKDGGRVPVYDKPLRDCHNIQKQARKIARIHRHIANQRLDALHKESTRIANSYDLVAVEDLDFRAMASRGFGNGKATLDNGGGMFYRFLDYKLRERGKHFVRIDRWFPSSQICSCCGYRDRRLKNLRIRKWTCPSCKEEHDRDHNSAKVIRKEGLRIFRERSPKMT